MSQEHYNHHSIYKSVLHHPGEETQEGRIVNSERGRIGHSFTLFLCFLGLGLTRTLQGPSLIDLKEQANIDLKDFQLIFLFGTLSFPLGNVLASPLVELCISSPMLLMSLLTIVFAALHTSIAFATTFTTLTASSASTEFVMGMVDTGCNVICLKLWSSTSNEGPFFTALHFLFGVGNVLGPIVVEHFLGDVRDPGERRRKLGYLGRGSLRNLSDLQQMHVCIGLGLLAVAFLFLIAFRFKLPANDISRQTSGNSRQMSKSHLEITLLALMTLFFCFANGINIAFSNFLTVFAVRSKLGLSKTLGARATSAYFASSCLMKFISIFLVSRVRVVLLITSNLFLLVVGCIVLLLFGEANSTFFFSGTVLVGLGISSLFSSGVVWLGERVEVSCRATTMFLVATSVGAQCFKVPIAGWIEETPMSLVHSLCGGSAVCAALFCASWLMAVSVRRKALELDKGKEMLENQIL